MRILSAGAHYNAMLKRVTSALYTGNLSFMNCWYGEGGLLEASLASRGRLYVNYSIEKNVCGDDAPLGSFAALVVLVVAALGILKC